MRLRIYKHLVYTWLLAQLLHPVLFAIYCNVLESGQLYFGWDHLPTLFSFMCFGIMISLPALLISAVSLRIILLAAHRPKVAFAAWILSVLLALNIGAWFMLFMFMGYFDLSFLGIFVPGMASAVISILFRFRQFEDMVYVFHYRRIYLRSNKIHS